MPRPFKNVRTRLTFWYVCALTVILLIYAGISTILVFINLRNNLDHQLEQDYEIIEDLIDVTPAGTVISSAPTTFLSIAQGLPFGR